MEKGLIAAPRRGAASWTRSVQRGKFYARKAQFQDPFFSFRLAIQNRQSDYPSTANHGTDTLKKAPLRQDK
jgi:hypothetical protein